MYTYLRRILLGALMVASTLGAKVMNITTAKEFNNIIERNKDKVIVVKYKADWCGPCKAFGPIFESVSDDASLAPRVLFINIDIDAAQGLPLLPRSVPTIQIFKGGNATKAVYERAGGMSKGELTKLIKSHLTPSAPARKK